MKRARILAALVLGAIPGVVQAASGGASCSVSATDVAFGAFNPLGSSLNSTGTISVTCSGGNSNNTYTIALSTGYGTYLQRTMKSGASILLYNLYTTAAHSTVWGDGTGTSATVAGTNGHTTSNFTVYGQLPAPQVAMAGSYSDTITVTVTY